MSICYYNETMRFFYNLSSKDSSESISETDLYIALVFGAICCLLIFLCNAMIIIAVVRNRQFHFPFYYLLANLAAADIFASLAYTFLMFHTGQISKTLTVHRYFLRQALLDVSFSASMYSLLVIAIERYFSVMKMMLHSNLSKRRVCCLILVIWAAAVFMSTIPNMGWHCICNTSTCSSLAPIYSRSFLVFWAIFNLSTFCIIVAIYLRIYMYVRKKTLNLSSHTTGSIKRSKMPMKLIKTIVVVLGAFIFCWTPGLIVVLLDGLHCTSCKVLAVKKWVLLLALINSLMNPIIYSYKDHEMWQAMKQMLCVGSKNKVETQQDASKSTSTRHSVISENADLANNHYHRGF
ncbi:lysophosphatidic acid receptor 3 [Heterodontus francisci]|uniref:lysophosphatidic acid receptor 3 n=1 Tax=Heterodontus francisci TaxID=7792 RepID=UPI00355BBDA1